MKKLLTLTTFFIVVFFGLGPRDGRAQIIGFTQSSFVDSTFNTCHLPAFHYAVAHDSVLGPIPGGDSITVYVNWGDTYDTTYKIVATPTLNTYHYHTYTVPGTFSVQLIYTASTGVADTMYTQSFIVSDTCANVSGRLYVDNNNNCTYDAGDDPFNYQMVKITNTNSLAVYYTYTDTAGNYSIDLPTNFTYDIEEASPWGGFTPSCPAAGVQTVTVTGGNYTEDLAYQCSATSDVDITTSGSAWTFRPGFNSIMYIYANTNNACVDANTSLTVTLDPQLSYVNTFSGPAPNTVAGNVLTWNFNNLNAWHAFAAGITVACDTNATLGDTLCNLAQIDTASGYHDPDTTNNIYNFCGPVTNAVDPNNKDVMPKGSGTSGYIAAGTNLTYVVNFQNTGNGPAINVNIKDTLDPNLDINTLHFISASHPVSITILPGNIVIFRFENIMLPDSGTNQAASHGYVMYSVQARPDLGPLSTINNTAHIYFDFNNDVPTNTTLNTIMPVSVQQIRKGNLKASVYPNPANDNVTVEVNGGFTLTVYDLLGRQLYTQKANNKAMINTASLPQGTYMLKLNNDTDELTTRINILH